MGCPKLQPWPELRLLPQTPEPLPFPAAPRERHCPQWPVRYSSPRERHCPQWPVIGNITDRYSYDAYGQMLGGDPSITAPASTDMLYSGEQFDPGLQMNYHRARYYDMSAGIWNRLDPFMGNHSDPQSLHKYAYCHGDPVNGVDPSGTMDLFQVIAGAGVISLLAGLFLIGLNDQKSSAYAVGTALISLGIGLIGVGVTGGILHAAAAGWGIGAAFTQGAITGGAIAGTGLAFVGFAYELVGLLTSNQADAVQKRNATLLLMQIVIGDFAHAGQPLFSRGEIYLDDGGVASNKSVKSFVTSINPKEAFSTVPVSLEEGDVVVAYELYANAPDEQNAKLQLFNIDSSGQRIIDYEWVAGLGLDKLKEPNASGQTPYIDLRQ